MNNPRASLPFCFRFISESIGTQNDSWLNKLNRDPARKH